MLKPKHRYSQAQVGLSADHPVRVDKQYHNLDYPAPVHDHEFYEIAFIRAGVMRHTTDSGTEQLGAGTVLILSPASVHSYLGYKRLELCNVCYLAEWFLSDVRALRGTDSLVPLFFERIMYDRTETPPVLRVDPSPSEFVRLMDEINDMDRAGASGGSLLYLESCFMKLITELATIYQRQYGRNFSRPVRAEVMRGLETIESIVATHRDFSARTVAQTVGLSLTRFDTLFRDYTGISPTDYYQKHRIQHVCRRLLGTALSITEVAQEYNYADAAHLNRYFRRYQNMTPGAYRLRFARRRNESTSDSQG